MSARLYPNAVELFIDDSISEWTAYEVKALLLSQAFVYDPSKVFRDELNEALVIAESSALEGASFDDGLASGQPFTFLALLDNRQVHHVVLYADTGEAAYSPLLAYLGPDAVTGLPFTPQGQDYFIYPVTPPGGFFQVTDAPLVGPLNTYGLAGPYALAMSEGGVSYAIPTLFIDGRLIVKDKICAPPVEDDSCCRPTIRGSRCE